MPSATTSGVPPLAGDALDRWREVAGIAPPCSVTQAVTASRRPCGSGARRPRSMPLIRVCAVNGTSSAAVRSGVDDRDASPSAKSTIERPSGVSSATEDSSAASASSSFRDPVHGDELRRHPVAVGDRAGLVQQQRRAVARRPRRPGRTWPGRCAAPCGPCRRCRSRTAGRRSWSAPGRRTARPARPWTGWPCHRPPSAAASTTATSRIRVMPAMRMSRAISFGVFCRTRPRPGRSSGPGTSRRGWT